MSARDSGLQPERTALAWQRTGLSAGIVGALLVRTGVIWGSLLGVVAAGCALAVVVLACWMGRRSGERGAPRWVLFATAVAGGATGFLTVVELLSTAK
jgi:hypothetical protein